MAGKNQHYLWQMLQRGFGERRGKDYHLFVYAADGSTQQTVTRKFGAETFFYSDGEDHTTDQAITDFENKYQGLINEMRNARDRQSFDSELVAPLIAHLEVRSAFVREEFEQLGVVLVHALSTHLEDPKSSRKMLTEYIKKHPEELENKLEEFGVDDDLRPTIRAAFTHNLDDAVRDYVPQMKAMSQLFLRPFADRMAETAKSAHLKSLLIDFDEIKRSESHKKLSYEVLRSDENLFLPDTTVAFALERRVTPITQAKDRVEFCILPLNTETYLLGYSGPFIRRKVSTVRRILASVTYKNFVAIDERNEFKGLTRFIGKSTQLIPDREIKRITSLSSLLEGI